jgi:hypothetical protein
MLASGEAFRPHPRTGSFSDSCVGISAVLGATVYYDWVYLVPELQWRLTRGTQGERNVYTGLINAVAIY